VNLAISSFKDGRVILERTDKLLCAIVEEGMIYLIVRSATGIQVQRIILCGDV
jgi:hypothetical protein